MATRKTNANRSYKLLLIHLRELQVMLNEMNQKLDHLIQSCRKFYVTDDFSSHSSNHEFKG